MAKRNWRPQDDWFHESRVQAQIKKTLTRTWGNPICQADTLKRQHGPDLLFKKNHRRLRIEVKGYPSEKYTSGKNLGKKKRTRPETQAPHWFSDAVMELILARSKEPSLQIALGLPRFRTYERKWKEISWAAQILQLACYWVEASGEVRRVANPEQRSGKRSGLKR